MSTSQEQFFSELAAGHSGPTIPEAKRVYFQTRLRNRLFNFILGKFVIEQKKGLSKAALARRIGKPPEVINRWLGAPSNLTLDTVSDLLLGISAEELTPEADSLLNQAPRNFLPDPWIKQEEQLNRKQPPRPKDEVDLGGQAQDRSKIPSPSELLGAQ
jgi:hypothetical protein